MVAARLKPERHGFSSKSKWAKLVGKRVRNDGVHFQRVGFTREPKQAKPAGKTVMHDGVQSSEEKWATAYVRMKEAVTMYRKLLADKKLLAELSQEEQKELDGRRKSGLSLHMRVAKALEHSGKGIDPIKDVGTVLGIAVGEIFHWRGELRVVGLHMDIQKGIDYTKTIKGELLATSIVDSGRYDNENTDPDKLTYCGEGENPNLDLGRKPKDQKLKGGNLALKNSMVLKQPVRVIRRVNSMAADGDANDCGYKFVYDGLYDVTDYKTERGQWGTDVYKFFLVKRRE